MESYELSKYIYIATQDTVQPDGICYVQWEDLVKLIVQFNVPLGTLCHPQTIPPGGMFYTICSEMYHEVLSLLLQTVHINCMLCTVWLE